MNAADIVPDPNDEAMQRAKDKLAELTAKESDPSPEDGEPPVPDSPKADSLLRKIFKDAPKQTPGDEPPPEKPEPTSAPIAAPPLDAGLSFTCSIHGEQPLKEIRYTTIILACGCEWIYDCGFLSQSRRGPKK